MVVGSVVVVVAEVEGNVVVVVVGAAIVVVVEVVDVVVDRAIAGVISTSVVTNSPLAPRESNGPGRSSERGDNFTHLTYFA
jgi:hypothetical protein